jgi:hypothetical protein
VGLPHHGAVAHNQHCPGAIHLGKRRQGLTKRNGIDSNRLWFGPRQRNERIVGLPNRRHSSRAHDEKAKTPLDEPWEARHSQILP